MDEMKSSDPYVEPNKGMAGLAHIYELNSGVVLRNRHTDMLLICDMVIWTSN